MSHKGGMLYWKTDLEALDHPRFTRAGPVACALWCWGTGFSRKHEEDGFVPMDAALMCPWLGANAEAVTLAAAKLVEVGLWTVAEKNGQQGWEIKNYSQKNETKKDIEKRRKQSRERANNFRQKRALAASENGQSVTALQHALHTSTVGALHPVSVSVSVSDSKILSSETTEEPSPDSNHPIPFVPRDPPIDAFAGTFAAQAWCEGVTAATGRPCTPLDRFGQRDLTVMLSAHAKGESGGAMMAWIRTVAGDYATATANERAFWKLTPRRCSEWLDAGRPKRPPKPGKIVQRDAPGELPCWTPRGTNR